MSIEAAELKEAALDLAREKLREGGTLQIPYHGKSMFPTLREGDQLIVTHAAAERLRVGRLILFPAEQGLTVHRLIKKATAGTWRFYQTRADASLLMDPPLELHEIVGVVRGRIRNGKTKSYFGWFQTLQETALTKFLPVKVRVQAWIDRLF